MYVKHDRGAFVPPVNIGDVKGFVRQDDDYEIELLNSIVEAATSYAEEYTNRKLQQTTVNAYLDDVTRNQFINLPFGELIAVTKVTVAGKPLQESKYKVNTFKNGITFTDNAKEVLITFTCGYKTPQDIPAPIKQAILMLCATMYEQREDEIADTGINSTPAIISSKILLNPYWLRPWEW